MRLISFLSFLSLSLLMPLASQSAPLKTIEAKFVKIAWGDYAHLVLEKDGKEISYWCHHSKPLTCDHLEAKSAFYKGKTLKVGYEDKEVYVEEAGGKIVQERAIMIELKKKK